MMTNAASDSSSGRCRACGSTLREGKRSGLCGACMRRALTSPRAAPEPPAAENVAFSLPGYDMLGEIARGGMGVVYRAWQREPGREVAVKMLLPQVANSEMRERFRNEAKLMAELDHPHILPLYQVGDFHSTPWFSMKLAARGSLAERLKTDSQQYRGQPLAAVSLVLDLLGAVAAAHHRGLLHRDIKPGNILFDAEDRAYVADFGLAKLAAIPSQLTRSGGMLGTPHYLAPELVEKDSGAATMASDVYAVGAVLYELLEGRPPFDAENLAGLLRKIAEDPVPEIRLRRSLSAVMPGTSVDLGAVIAKALAKDQRKRYRDAEAFAEDLEAWREGRPVTARPPSFQQRCGYWLRSHPAWAATLGMVMLAVVTIFLLQAKSARILRVEKATALAAQVKAALASGSPETRDAALVAARAAADIQPTADLRDDVIPLLLTPGLRPWRTLPLQGGEWFPLDVTHQFASEIKSGQLFISELGETAPKVISQAPEIPGQTLTVIRWLGKNASFCLVRSASREHFLYDRAKATWVRSWPAGCYGMAISPDEQSLAYGREGGNIVTVEDLLTGKIRNEWPTLRRQAMPVAYSPRGLLLAVSDFQNGGVDCLDLLSGKVWNTLDTILMDRSFPRVAWRPDSQALAMAMGASDLFLAQVAFKPAVTERVSGHLAEAYDVAWHPSGRWFVSCGFDSTVRLWDGTNRREVLSLPLSCDTVQFSEDGTSLVCVSETYHSMQQFHFEEPKFFRETALPHASGDAGRQRPPWGMDVTPDGKLAAVATDTSLNLVETATGKLLGKVSDGYFNTVAFCEEGKYLVYGCDGLYRVKLSYLGDAKNTVLVPSSPEKILDALINRLSYAAAPGLLACTDGSSVQIVKFREEGTPATVLPGQPGFMTHTVAISPDGRWVVSGFSDQGSGLLVWDLHQFASQPQALSGFQEFTNVQFSPDNTRLYASGREQQVATLVALEVGTWRPIWRHSSSTTSLHLLALSGDGKLLAWACGRSDVQLLDAAHGEILTTLRHPQPGSLGWLALDHAGAQLVLTTLPDSLQCWNLRGLRRELHQLALDWLSPPYAEAPPAGNLLFLQVRDQL